MMKPIDMPPITTIIASNFLIRALALVSLAAKLSQRLKVGWRGAQPLAESSI